MRRDGSQRHAGTARHGAGRAAAESSPWRVLLIEDSEHDAELIVHALQRVHAVRWQRVDTAAALRAALADAWDLVTCDWQMPGLGGLAALPLVRAAGVEAPVVVVSGEVDDEVTRLALGAGADDVISKRDLPRLAPVVERELDAAAERRERTRLFDAVFDHSLSCLVLLDSQFNFVRVNAAYAEACHRPLADFAGRNHFELFPSDARAIFEEVLRTKRPFEVKARSFSFPDQPERGETYWDWTLVPILDAGGAVELLLFSLHDVTEHVRTGRALQVGEQRFRALIEQSLDLIAIVDAKGIYRYVNPAHEAVCGFRPDQMVGMSAFALIHPEDAKVLVERFRSAVAGGGKSAPIEYRLQSRGGGWRFIEGVALNLVDDPGVGGVLVSGRDVTERRRAEDELRARGERLKLTLRVANIAAFTQDRDFRYTWMQHPQLGFRVEDVLGHTDEELLVGRDITALVALKRQVMATGVGARQEFAIDDGGRPAHFDVILEPLRDAAGAIAGLSGASFDITAHKRTEQALRAHALRLEIVQGVYRAILGAGPVGDVVGAALPRMRQLVPCDIAFVLLADPAAGVARLIGAEADSVERFRDLQVVPLSDFPTLDMLVAQSEIYVADLHAVRPRSRFVRRAVEAGARTLLTEALVADRELLGALTLFASTPDAHTAEHRAIAREVADQLAVAIDRARLHERLERRVRERTADLERANRDLDSFTYSVSHDLRAPLRRIEGFSRALLEDYGAGLAVEARRYVDAIVQGSTRMGQLIEDLLRLARLAQHELVRERVDLTALALAIRGELHATDPRRQVVWTIAPGVVVDGDARLLRVLLENLLGNAWKFTGGRAVAHIELGVEARPDGPVYFVRDDGAGFDMAYAERLFGVFQRLHSETEFEGTGIGLATVQRIVHGHGGAIWGEAAIDRGATFYFTLGGAA
ncbi:PAS domain-containing protein [bacterium]|nr:PAS domain-containing protein [bacterium]